MKKISKKQKLIIIVSIVTIIIIIGLLIGVNAIKSNIANSIYESSNGNSSNGNLLPEYIKAGITLGGVTGTLKDLDTSDATATEWEVRYGKTCYVNGERIEGVYVPKNTIKVGDYVEYIPNTYVNYTYGTNEYVLPSSVSGYANEQRIPQEDFKWRILNINTDGTIDLISSESTENEVHITKALGYNNGVNILNDICYSLYGNSQLSSNARSIKVEDIYTKLNSKGVQAKDDFENEPASTYTNSRYTYYPLLYQREKGSGINTTYTNNNGINPSDGYYDGFTTENYGHASSLTVKKNDFGISPNNIEVYFDDDVFIDMIFESGYSWVATRYAGSNSGIFPRIWIFYY